SERDEQVAAVDTVLAEIGANEVPQIRVLNKIDLAGLAPGVECDGCGNISTVRLSALTGAGCADLRSALGLRFPAASIAVHGPEPLSSDSNDQEATSRSG